MTRLLPLLLCLFAIAALAQDIHYRSPLLPKVNLASIVEGLRAVEHWDGVTTGAAGEWGFWQFTPELWHRLSLERHRGASVEEQRAAAFRHVRWIIRRLPELGLPETPFSIGLVWSAGYGNVADGRITRSKIEYANRVKNVYDAEVVLRRTRRLAP